MSYWEFMDFVDENGVNQVDAWLDVVGIAVRDRLDDRIKVLEQHQQLGEPQVKVRQALQVRLLEIIFKEGKVQRRPLACYGPGRGQVTILAGAYEKNDRLYPHGIEDTAIERMAHIYQEGRVTKHVLYKRTATPDRKTH